MVTLTVEELIAIIEARGARQAESDVRRVQRAVDDTEKSFKRMGASLRQLELFSVATGIGALIANLDELLVLIGAVSGITIAAEFRAISLALRNVTGDTEKAVRLLKELKVLGRQSPYSTAEVSSFAARMIGAGVPQNKVMPELTSIMDIAAFGQLPNAEIGVFMRNLLQIRGRDSGRPNKRDLNELFDRVPAARRLLAAGLGTDVENVNKKAEGLTGREMYEALMRGRDALAKGAAAAAALQNPMYAVANLFETLRMIMEPTGQILLTGLMPVLFIMQKLAEAALNVNERLGGSAGLVLLIGALAVGMGVLVASVKKAIIAVGELSAAIQVLAASTATAGAAGGAGAAGTAAAAAAGVGVGAAASGARGWLPKIMGAGKAILRGGIIGTAIAMIGDIAGNAIQGNGQDQKRNEAGNIVKWASTGAGIGALIGSIIPGIGTMVGALIGGALGTLGAAIQNRFFEGGKPTAPDNQIADNTKRAAEALEEIKSRIYGGGPRTSAAISMAETEYAIQRALNLGVG